MNKILQKMMTLAMAATMVAPTAVSAEDATANIKTTEGTIDHDLTGSITLFKFMDNDGKSIDGEGIPYASSDAEITNWIKQHVSSTAMPEKGVKFKYLKVADIEQVTENTVSNGKDSHNTSGTYYTNIDEQFFNLMNQYLGQPKALQSSAATKKKDAGKENTRAAHYESDELNEKMMDVIRSTGGKQQAAANPRATWENVTGSMPTGEVALGNLVRANGTDFKSGVTDENGKTTTDELPLGLYLIVEADYEHSALAKRDTYWEVVDTDYANTPGNTHGAGTTADGESDTASGDVDDGKRTDAQGNQVDNSSQSAGVNAGGSSYADIVSPSSPFLVSVPMTNVATVNGHEPGTIWQYDITAYPKNGSLTIHKDILTTTAQRSAGRTSGDDNDTVTTETPCDFHQTNYVPDETKLDGTVGGVGNQLTHQIDANIGDIITQLISVDVPRLVDDIDDENDVDGLKDQTGSGLVTTNTNTPKANSANTTRKHNAKFVVTDRMTKGLNLISADSFKVTLGQGAWNDQNNQELVRGTDYILDMSADRMTYTLTITPAGLKKLDDIPSASYLYVLYDTVLTKDALIGTDTYNSQRTIDKDADTISNQTHTGNRNQGTSESNAQSDNADDTVTNNTPSDAYVSKYGKNANNGTKSENADTVNHGDATNQNTAQLTYATDRTEEHDYYSNTVKVFTYELDLTKNFTDGTAGHVSKNDTATSKNGKAENNKEFDYSKVKFTIRGEAAGGSTDAVAAQKGQKPVHNNKADGTYDTINVSETAETNNEEDGTSRKNINGTGVYEQLLFIKTGDGTYRVWDPLTDNTASFDNTTNAEKTTRDSSYEAGTFNGNVMLNADTDKLEDYTYNAPVGTVSKYVIPNSTTGLLTIKGLDSRTYELTEVATAPGRNLMADKVYIELHAPEGTETNGLASTAGGAQGKLENGSVAHAYIYTGERPSNAELQAKDGKSAYDLATYSVAKQRLDIGRVPFMIQNNEIIKVLKTGGKGAWLYVGVGAGIMAICAIAFTKKKKDEEDEPDLDNLA